MNIVILGAGSIGSHLAKVLSKEEHNVVVIDRDGKALEKLSRSADIATRLGSGTDWELLEELTEISPDLFIALSRDDETNLAACAIAKNLGYPKTAARIRQDCFLNHCRLDFSRLFYVDHILGTELILAHDIFTSIVNPGNLAVENFAHGAVQMRTVVIPPTFEQAGKSLSQVTLNDNLLVGLIRRKIAGKPEAIIFPKGQDLLLAGDEATIIGQTAVMNQLHEIFGTPRKSVRSATLLGASSHLCKLLLEQKISVKVIEADEQKCLRLAKAFPEAVVLNHEGADYDFFQEEAIANSDVFVACTNSAETNILAAALARQVGCGDVIAVVSDESFSPLLEQLNIRFTLSERASVGRRIHSILHDDAIVSVASLYDNRAKIMEVKISPDSEVVGAPISDISSALPQNFLIALIENRSGITIPKGSNVLAPGDTAIVICSPETVREVERIL